MRIVVIGGTGLIGKKLISLLIDRGCEAVAASPATGVNTITGEGLTEVLTGASVVIDVSNSPSFEDRAVLEFFETSTRNLLAAEVATRVSHHVALSVVGADRLPDSGYLRAKVAQEKLITSGKIPYTIVRATQFFEFLGGIAEAGAYGSVIRLPDAPMQPLAADDVASFLANIALEPPVNTILELAGPEAKPMTSFVEMTLVANGDTRVVVADSQARYFGTALDARGLTPDGVNPRIGPTRFIEWLSRSRAG